jgi:hypothetical protein
VNKKFKTKSLSYKITSCLYSTTSLSIQCRVLSIAESRIISVAETHAPTSPWRSRILVLQHPPRHSPRRHYRPPPPSHRTFPAFFRHIAFALPLRLLRLRQSADAYESPVSATMPAWSDARERLLTAGQVECPPLRTSSSHRSNANGEPGLSCPKVVLIPHSCLTPANIRLARELRCKGQCDMVRVRFAPRASPSATQSATAFTQRFCSVCEICSQQPVVYVSVHSPSPALTTTCAAPILVARPVTPPTLPLRTASRALAYPYVRYFRNSTSMRRH